VKAHVDPPGRTMFQFGAPIRVSEYRLSGTRVALQETLGGLIVAAYHLRPYQILGDVTLPGPGGRDQLYEIDARTPGDKSPPADQVRAMLRNLLAERFQLRVHRETKEMPAYDLTLSGGGSKLVASVADAETKVDVKGGLLLRLDCTNVTIAELIGRIDNQFDRPLIDRTGLTGGYDFALEYTRRRPIANSAADAEAVEKLLGPEDNDKSIVPGLRKLGLRVVPAKERVEVLVVDHVERPSEN
jgi:uncharacterized protein (TIGR03435 family)